MEKLSKDIHNHIMKMWRGMKIKMVFLFFLTGAFGVYFFIMAENTPQYVIGSLFALMSLLCVFGYGLGEYYLRRYKKQSEKINQLFKKIKDHESETY